MKSTIKFVVVFLTIILLLTNQHANSQGEIFVDIKNVIPSIQLDIRYHSDYNFVGQRIDGYNTPKCLLTRNASQALSKVQKELMRQSYSLKIYDCYRPQRAVNHFIRWAQNTDDQRMKSKFYPNINKQDLFIDGYIATTSSHSRGSAVDLTIARLHSSSQPIDSPRQAALIDSSIDMGTPFDFFDPRSHTVTNQISEIQQKNRLLLKAVMKKYGFKNYSQEWWHYNFKDEPFGDKYFDFSIN